MGDTGYGKSTSITLYTGLEVALGHGLNTSTDGTQNLIYSILLREPLRRKAQFLPPEIKLGLSLTQNRLEQTKNLVPEIGSRFHVGEWPFSESGLLCLSKGIRKSGKSPFTRIVLNGSWSSKEPITLEALASWVRSNHCLTKDLDDLLNSDRNPFWPLRSDDQCLQQFSWKHLMSILRTLTDRDRVGDSKTAPAAKTRPQISATSPQELSELIRQAFNAVHCTTCDLVNNTDATKLPGATDKCQP
jgi:hypothetical protein